MIIPLTADNFVCNAEFQKMEKVINVSNELGARISCCPLYHVWQYIEAEDTFKLIPLMDNTTLRERRKVECFNIIDNKSILWWNSLSKEDETEVKQWYSAWLNVTNTKVIPELPKILNVEEN